MWQTIILVGFVIAIVASNPVNPPASINDILNELFSTNYTTTINEISNLQNTFSDNNLCKFGVCTPSHMCITGGMNIDGRGMINQRFGPNEITCKDPSEICCINLKNTEPPSSDQKISCGHRNVDSLASRISEDTYYDEAKFGEFPWMVAITLQRDNLNLFQCGGSLIHPSVVLTAAHCVQGKEVHKLQIRAGEWDTQTENENFPHQNRQVSEVVIHEQYYDGGLFNDVALLYLTAPVDLAENVNTACLPPQGEIFDGSRCFASGWGKDLWGKEGKYQVILKKIELPIIPREPCLDALRHTRLGHRFQLHKSFICAGGEAGKDTCKGDGGSPLVCPIYGRHEQYYQAGIVSWGMGCATAIPGVYVDVAGFRNWIDEQFDSKHLDKRHYIA